MNREQRRKAERNGALPETPPEQTVSAPFDFRIKYDLTKKIFVTEELRALSIHTNIYSVEAFDKVLTAMVQARREYQYKNEHPEIRQEPKSIIDELLEKGTPVETP